MDSQILDMDAYAELKSIMGDTINEVIVMYLSRMPELLDSLGTQIQNRNANEVFEIAHQIKSSSGSIGATGIADTAATIEQSGREGSTENTLSGLEKLKRQYEEIRSFLSAELNS